MKKVESFIGFDGVRREWDEVENLYYEDLFTIRGRYQTPLRRLQDLLTDPSFRIGHNRNMLLYLIDHFERIIKANPVELSNIIQVFSNNNWQPILFQNANNRLTQVGKKILKAFSYESLRSTKLLNLASLINIKSCLYCNSQFTLVVERGNRKMAKYQFDHFFPKNRYPYLSISLYNLIPSCSSCNQSKHDKFYQLSELIHPYHEDFQNLTHFSINPEAHIQLLMGANVQERDIQVSLSNLEDERVKNQNSFTLIESIYKRHNDIVIEIYKKAYAYKMGGKESLMNMEHKGRKLFASEDELEWLLLANYKEISDINKRPLAKFMQDIAKQAGLIN